MKSNRRTFGIIYNNYLSIDVCTLLMIHSIELEGNGYYGYILIAANIGHIKHTPKNDYASIDIKSD